MALGILLALPVVTLILLLYIHQEYGSLDIDSSVEGNLLKIGGQSFPRGFGSHGRSEIVLKLPKKAKGFRAFVGLDDEVNDGKVCFSSDDSRYVRDRRLNERL